MKKEIAILRILNFHVNIILKKFLVKFQLITKQKYFWCTQILLPYILGGVVGVMAIIVEDRPGEPRSNAEWGC